MHFVFQRSFQFAPVDFASFSRSTLFLLRCLDRLQLLPKRLCACVCVCLSVLVGG